ncbi:MAG TPA: hypothetical protein VLW65_14605 [Bryobacteraceae bacterium]|nr:hypothetical protein [Bryobacteraceae bacterium]
MKQERLAILIPILLAIRFIAMPGLAQTTPAMNAGSGASWENLRRLSPGQKIQVVQKDRKSWSGAFVGFSDESMSLKAADGNKTVGRSEVMRVSRHGGKRARNALIAAAAGAGVGVAIGAGVGGCNHNQFGPCIGRGLAAAVMGTAAALVGVVIGVAIPGNTVIYRAPAQ